MLKILSGACAGGAAAAVGLPALRALIDTRAKLTVVGSGAIVRIAKAGAIPTDGTPVKLPVIVETPKDAWVSLKPTEIGSVYVQRSEGKLVAFTTVCPHLGCSIDYLPAKRQFGCPCHESAFDLNGNVIGGPSPRSMDRLETPSALRGESTAQGSDDEEWVSVRYVRFKQGTKEKIPI